MPPLTIGSLFAGIGGLELGLERAGLGPVLWQVENNPHAQKVLQRHWPEATRYDDVRTVGKRNLPHVDLICGGFPCQDVSAAGTHAGLQGSRSGLWYEFERIVTECCPSWVVVENVASGATRWVDTVVGGLERLGYACLPIPLAASDVGAPHERKRVFVIAHNQSHGRGQGRKRGPDRSLEREPEPSQWRDAPDSDGHGQSVVAKHGQVAQAPCAPRGAAPGHDQTDAPSGHWASLEPGLVPLVHGVSTRMAGRVRREQIRLLGNAVVPQCAEVVGWVIRELLEDE